MNEFKPVICTISLTSLKEILQKLDWIEQAVARSHMHFNKGENYDVVVTVELIGKLERDILDIIESIELPATFDLRNTTNKTGLRVIQLPTGKSIYFEYLTDQRTELESSCDKIKQRLLFDFDEDHKDMMYNAITGAWRKK